jgi:hypothetical protein
MNPVFRPSKTCVIFVICVIAIEANDRAALLQLTTDN